MTRRAGSRLLIITLMLIATAVGTSSPAVAVDNGRFSLVPTAGPGAQQRPYFVYSADAGAQLQDSVTLSNNTDAPITFDLYASDATNTPDGGFALHKPDDPKVDVGAWIRLPASTLTVQPHTAAAIPFQLNPPTNAVPGDHAGGIVALDEQTRPQGTGQGAPSLNARDGVGARVYLRVNGDTRAGVAITAMKLSVPNSLPFLAGGTTTGSLTFTVKNTGNVRVTPDVGGTVDGPFGIASRDIPHTEVPELLPGSSATVTVKVTGLRALVRLTAHLKVDGQVAGASAVSASGDTTTIAMPWVLVALVVLLLIVWRYRRRRQRRAVARPPDPDRTEPALVSA